MEPGAGARGLLDQAEAFEGGGGFVSFEADQGGDFAAIPERDRGWDGIVREDRFQLLVVGSDRHPQAGVNHELRGVDRLRDGDPQDAGGAPVDRGQFLRGVETVHALRIEKEEEHLPLA